MSRLLRQVVFAVLALALAGTGVFLVGAHGSGTSAAPGPVASSSPPPAAPTVTPSLPVATAAAAPPPASRATAKVGPSLRRSAGRFVWAFLSYEVGGRSRLLRRVLRETSTGAFFGELASSPPVPVAAGRPQPAAVGRLRVGMVSSRPPVALVSGVAHRPDGPEEFSFLFVHDTAGWRASGPGE